MGPWTDTLLSSYFFIFLCRLPQFSAEEAASLRGSLDVLGINYYMAFLASSGACSRPLPIYFRPCASTVTSRRYHRHMHVPRALDPPCPPLSPRPLA